MQIANLLIVRLGLRRHVALAPGIVLCAIVVLAAQGLSGVTYVGVLSVGIWAVILGTMLSDVMAIPEAAVPGVRFSGRTLLRLGIVLLGLQIPIADIVALGLPVLALIVAASAGTLLTARLAGRALGVGRELSELIGAGTAICGASAILAVNAATRARQEEVAYALSCVTLFGTLAMLGLPTLALVFGLDPLVFSLWAGSAIHEVAQVAGAATQYGTGSEEMAMVAKLSRVLLLAPLVILLLALRRGDGDGAARSPVPAVPGFLLGFLALMALANTAPLPVELVEAARLASRWLLAVALAALGLSIEIGQLRRKGFRPLVLAGVATLFITTTTLAGLAVLVHA